MSSRDQVPVIGQEAKPARLIDLTDLPDGDGYRIVALGDEKTVVRESDGAVWDGTTFVATPVLTSYCYAVTIRATSVEAGKDAIERALPITVSVEPIHSFVARDEA